MEISKWEFLAVCYDTDKFGDCKHCESWDMFLICHVTSPDHIFKMLYVNLWVETFHVKSPSCQVGGYWLCASGDIKYLIFYVTLLNHAIEEPCKTMRSKNHVKPFDRRTM